ncbi:MAG TPA: N-acetylmuramoyl-L-alanine amidase [Gemmatimonadaceae bacterium]
MNYTADSPIHSRGTVSAAAIDAWFREMGRALAPQYAPDRTYREPPPIGADIIRVCADAEAACGEPVNSDLVAAQICKESAGWQSAIVRDKNNPSGLGAVNNDPYGGAVRFATPYEGIRATVAHLLTYTLGRRNPWWDDDPRAAAVPEYNLGVVRVLRDLEQRWAWSPPERYNATPPDQRYGAGIARLANELVAFAEARNEMSAQIPGFIWYPANDTHYTKGRSQRIRGGAQHYTAGTNSLLWLTSTSGQNDPNARVSAHFLVKHDPTMEDRGWQLVRIEDTAWTTAFANPYTVSIEYEHLPGHHAGIPDMAYEVLAQTWIDIADYVRRHNLGEIPLNRSGIKGHKEWVGNPSLICPDGIDMDRIVATIQRRLNAAAPAPQGDVIQVGPFGRHIGHGFLAFWRRLDSLGDHMALRTLGYPLTEEFSIPNIPGTVFQVFERGILRFDPSQPEPWRVHVAMPQDAWVRDWARERGLLGEQKAA